jgi:hypothetical protein
MIVILGARTSCLLNKMKDMQDRYENERLESLVADIIDKYARSLDNTPWWRLLCEWRCARSCDDRRCS